MLTGPDDGCGSRPVTWRLADSRGEKQVELVTSGADVRLSIGLGDDEEPAFTGALADLLMVSMGRPWRFVRPGITRAEVAGHDGVLTVTCSVGGLDVNLSLRFDGDFLLVDVTWRNSGEVRLVDVAVGLVLDLPERADERITIPGVVYNDNPSADPSREVPRIGPAPGGGYVCEEHRLPIPAVNVEWVDGAGSRFLNVHSRPAYVDAADGTVHYGSLGVHRTTGGPSVAALSGVVMCGGRPDITYVHKGTTAGYDAGYLDFPPGFVLTKGYALDWGTVGKRGQGFRALVNRRLPWWETAASPPLDLDQMIRLKTQAMDARWAVDGSLAGWLKFPSWGEPASSRPVARDFLYGWTGQCLRLAWCDAQVGFDESTPERVARGRRAVDCYVAGSGTAVPGLRLNACAVDEKRWHGFVRDGHEFVSSRAYGETLCDIADIVALFRSHGAEVPPAWTTTLTDAADFLVDATLPDGIPPLGWRLDGTPHA
ncbi:MAG: hypothetical protein ACRDP8_14225, partial [Actinopolymorphaceae bacterium]